MTNSKAFTVYDRKRFGRRFHAWLSIGVAALLTASCAGTDSTTVQNDGEGQGGTPLSVSFFSSGLSIPVMVGIEAGYYEDAGLDMEFSNLQSGPAGAALASGQLDVYFGGTQGILVHVSGVADTMYAAAPVDRSPVRLIVDPDQVSSWDDLKGKSVATTGVGAFGEVVMKKWADRNGMTAANDGADVTLVNTEGNSAAVALLVNHEVAGAIVTAPADVPALDAGFEILTDFAAEGERIIGPGVAVTREFFEENQGTLKAFLEAQMRSVHKALNDEDFAKQAFLKYTNQEGDEVAQTAYDENKELWNVDMTVCPEPIETVLNYSDGVNPEEWKAEDFYDNSLIDEVNASVGAELFPDVDFGATCS